MISFLIISFDDVVLEVKLVVMVSEDLVKVEVEIVKSWLYNFMKIGLLWNIR